MFDMDPRISIEIASQHCSVGIINLNGDDRCGRMEMLKLDGLITDIRSCIHNAPHIVVWIHNPVTSPVKVPHHSIVDFAAEPQVSM